MAVNPVIGFELYVNDMARARAFYESVFEVSLESMGEAGMEYDAFPMQTPRWGPEAPWRRWRAWPRGEAAP